MTVYLASIFNPPIRMCQLHKLQVFSPLFSFAFQKYARGVSYNRRLEELVLFFPHIKKINK